MGGVGNTIITQAVGARAGADRENEDGPVVSTLEMELSEARETVRDLSAALSAALDENARLRRLLPVPAPSRHTLPRPPAIRLRRA